MGLAVVRRMAIVVAPRIAQDRSALVRVGDQRLGACTIPGPGMAQMPPAQTRMEFCQEVSAQQFVDDYLRRMLVRDLGLSDPRVVGPFDRPDQAQRSQERVLNGLPVRYLTAELHFAANRAGTPVAGSVLGTVTLLYAPQGQNFQVGTQSFGLTVFAGPPQSFDMLARLTGAIGVDCAAADRSGSVRRRCCGGRSR